MAADVVSDDFNAIRADEVAAVTKPDADTLWFLNVTLKANTIPVTCRFGSLEARDDFYEKLVSAMS